MAETTNGPQDKSEEQGNQGSPEDPDIARLEQLANDERLNVRSQFQLPDPPKMVIERPGTQKKKPSEGRLSQIASALPGDSPGQAAATRNTALASTVGITLVASLIVGMGLGWLLDKFVFHNGPTPWGMVIGVLVGMVAGFMNVLKVTAQMRSDNP